MIHKFNKPLDRFDQNYDQQINIQIVTTRKNNSKSQPQQIFKKHSYLNKINIIKFLLIFILYIQLFICVQCQCNDKPITQQFYISPTSSCTFKFDSCNNNKTIKCQKFQVPSEGFDFLSIMQSANDLSCKKYCCENYQDQKNTNLTNSLKVCKKQEDTIIPIIPTKPEENKNNSNQTSQSTSGWTIIFIFIGTAIIFLVFIFCDKKYKKQSNPQQSTTGLPPTAVDLKGHDLDSQGPYFVNANDTCAICLDLNVNLRTHCNHFYHGKCLVEWLKKKINNPCPLCMSIQYNPIKLYCKECHTGDKLINIEASTSQQLINVYDVYKCGNCKKFGDNSFTMSEENNEKGNNLDRLIKSKKDILNQQMDQSSEVNDQETHNQSSNPKKKRKLNKLKRAQNKSKLQKSNDNYDQSQKQMKNPTTQNQAEI